MNTSTDSSRTETVSAPQASGDQELEYQTAPRSQEPTSPLRHSRVGSVRIALITSAVVLILLLIFILQNGHSVKVSFLGASGHMPLAVAMLFAAIAGALMIAIPGSVRILQLRHGARRQHRADTQR